MDDHTASGDVPGILSLSPPTAGRWNYFAFAPEAALSFFGFLVSFFGDLSPMVDSSHNQRYSQPRTIPVAACPILLRVVPSAN